MFTYLLAIQLQVQTTATKRSDHSNIGSPPTNIFFFAFPRFWRVGEVLKHEFFLAYGLAHSKRRCLRSLTSSHISFALDILGSTEVDVKDAPGRPVEYGETFPGGWMRTCMKNKFRNTLQGTSALTFATSASGAGFALSAALFATAAEDTDVAGGIPCGF